MKINSLASIHLKLIVVAALVILMITAVPAQTEAELKDATVKGLSLFEQGNYADAAPHLAIMVQAIPDQGNLRFMYGFSLLAKSKQIKGDQAESQKLSAQALVQFQEAKKLGVKEPELDELIKVLGGGSTPSSMDPGPKPSPTQKFMEQAESYFAQSKYDEAIKFYQKALDADPKLYEAALYMGDCYTSQKDWPNAEKSYQKAIAIDPLRETAYRYSGTPLMEQKKFDEARDRYIEAYITEPYSKMSLRGIDQWANITSAKLGHPQIDIPDVTYDSSGKATTAINKKDVSESDKAWLAYGAARELWHKEKFLKSFPGEKTYRHSLGEEVDSIRSTLKSAKDQKLTDPQLTILQKMDDEGLLESYLLLTAKDEGVANDHPAYLKDNRAKMRLYVLNYVIHK